MNTWCTLAIILAVLTVQTNAQSTCKGKWGSWTNGTCSETCGMFGVMQTTRSCQPPECTCNGNNLQATYACPTNACLLPKPKCAAGYVGYIDLVAKKYVCSLATTTPVTTTTPLPGK